MKIQHVSTACVLLEIDNIHILTDPVFDPPGKTYQFLPGFYSKKLDEPSIPAHDLPSIDVILLSHHHHADNLDNSGRRLTVNTPLVLSTPAAAKSLKMQSDNKCFGLADWQVFDLAPLAPDLEVIAVPSQHYQKPLARWIVGETIGFLIRRKSTQQCIYFSGDTVLFDGLNGLQDFRIQYAFLNMGGVQFPLTGWLRYTLNLKEAVALSRITQPSRIFPVHFNGWTHFKEKLIPTAEKWEEFSNRVELLNRSTIQSFDF